MWTIYKKLNVSPNSFPLVIPIKQYSSDFALKFKLYSTDGDLDIEAGATTKIRGTKRDGNGFELAGTRIGNTCTFSGTKAQMQQMTAAHGRCVFEIVVENNTRELITANFYLEVQRAAMDAGTVTSESIIEEFTDFQSKITAAQAAATAAQEQADRAEAAAESIDFGIDPTLSRSGQAADALETGKIKAELYNSEIFNVSDWENGGIVASTGANTNHSSRIRTKSYLPWGIKKLYSTNTNVRFLVYAYKDGAYVGGWWNDGTFNPSDVKGVTSVDFDVFYRNPDFEGYQYRACIYINSGTARVETISGIYIDVLPVKDFLNLCVNNSLERVMRIPDSTDLDTLMSAGNYYVENYASFATMIHTPPEAAQGGRLWVGYGVSALRPYQIWLSFSSKDEPYFYMRIRKADAWGKWNLIGKTQPVNIRVLGYNIGKFNYGFDHTSPHVDDINTKIVNYKKMFGKVNSDLMLFAELTDYIDTSDTINTDTTLIQPLFKTRVNFHGCASVTNLMASKLENDGGVYLRNNNNEYAGAVGRLVCDIGNRKLIISGGFLRVLSSAQDRLEAFKNYINSIIDYDYSIIYLDTNVLNNEERETLYSEAVAAGYTVCNGGYFGLINTLVPTDMYKPIDNIFVKGNIKVKNFEVLKNEYDNLASDHLPIVADLTLY